MCTPLLLSSDRKVKSSAAESARGLVPKTLHQRLVTFLPLPGRQGKLLTSLLPHLGGFIQFSKSSGRSDTPPFFDLARVVNLFAKLVRWGIWTFET
jgi:hypothetical protein